MGYRYVDHVTDVIVEVDAASIDDAFAEAAHAVADITLNQSSVAERETRPIAAGGPNMHHALLDWLEAANLVMITDGFAVRRFEARVSGNGPCVVRGIAHGEPLDIQRHGFRVEVKAPTFHMMDITESPDRVSLRFLLDL